MRHVVAAGLWFFVSAWWFLADGWLAVAMGALRVDLAVAFCLFAAFVARPASLPWLVLCAGLARALTLGGAAAVHTLLLAVPICVLFPLRRLHLPPMLLHFVAAGVTALALPVLPLVLRGGAAGALPPLAVPGAVSLLWTMVTAPLAAAVLGRLPPLWFYREPTR